MATVVPGAWDGIGVDARGQNYPFVAPSPDVRHVLADFYLAHDRAAAPLPLRLARLTGFDSAFAGGTDRCDVVVVDAAGAVVLDSILLADYRARAFGPRFRVHEWYADAAVCRVVQRVAFPDPQSVAPVPAAIAPADGRLDARTCDVVPRRVLRLADAATGTAAGAGDLALVGGYNVALAAEAASAGLRVITRLTATAAPGGGEGRYPGCATPDLVLRTINRIGPDAGGNFGLGARGCYWARQPTTLGGAPAASTPTPGTLGLGNDCGPCCDCDDFVRVQRGILRTWDRFVGIAGDAEATRDAYAAIVARWQQERECVEARVVSVNVAAVGDSYLQVVAGVCNHTAACLLDTTLTLAVVEAPAAPQVLKGSATITVTGRGQQRYRPATGPGGFVAYFDSIQARGGAALRMTLYFPGAAPGSPVTVRAAASTATPLAGVRLPQSATATAALGV